LFIYFDFKFYADWYKDFKGVQMAQNMNKGPVLVKCLNDIGCILINNENLLEACLTFRNKLMDKMNVVESRNTRQRRYNCAPVVPKAKDGFMLGAVRAHYYIRGIDGWNKLPHEDQCIAASGKLEIKPGNHSQDWLNAPPELCPKGYDFINPEDIREELKKFHAVYFNKTSSAKPRKINTIYGMPFTEFHDYYMEENDKDKSIPKKYGADLDKCKGRKHNVACTAQQLIVYVGNRVVELRREYRDEIIPLIEICEVWFPASNSDQQNRKWPQYYASCPCESCKTVLPYLITYKGCLGNSFKDMYRELLGNFVRKKGYDGSFLNTLGLSTRQGFFY
jgi:hypothetical protein